MVKIKEQSQKQPQRGRFLQFRTIRNKLAVVLIVMGTLGLVTVATAAFIVAQRSLENQTFAQLEALRETRSDQLALWFNDRRSDALTLSSNPNTILAATGFDLGVENSVSLGESYDERLQAVADSYRSQPEIADNGDGSAYTAAHLQHHPFFKEFSDTYGYGDIFIVAADGDIIYTVNKGPDFGTNLVDGPYADTNLAAAFKQTAAVQDPTFTMFEDFAFYGPTNQPASFFASPIYNDDSFIGVLILQLPVDIMDAIMNQRAGLGESGETYVVGTDLLFRNDSRFLDQLGEDTTILNETWPVNTVASRSALAGESGREIIDDYRGIPVLSAWKPIVLQEKIAGIDSEGVTWAIMAEIDEAEARQPVNNFLTTFLIIGAVGLAVIIGLAVFLANQVATPVQKLTRTAEQIAAGDLSQRANVTTDDEIGMLAVTFNQMTSQLEETVGTLEQRVAERTQRLEVAAALNERLSAILDIDQLLEVLVNQVKDSFGYYHVHVYIIDEAYQNLIMAAGVGEAGASMKAAGHSIPIDAPTSLVARAARTGDIVSIDNVREAADWLPNPLLPDTYAEMATPIILTETGQVVGVLDVQEDRVAALDESDAALLRTLANQVAIAIRNARLFEEVETGLARVKAAQERYVEQSWEKVRIASRRAEHLHVRSDVAPPLPEEVVNDAKQLALQQEKPKVVTINGDATESETESPIPESVVAPVILSGKTIGVLQVHRAKEGVTDKPWTDDDLAVVETILDQVAQTAENLRLFDETRQQAEYERTIGEITQRIRQAPNMEALTQIAANELGQILGASHSLVEIGSDAPLDASEAMAPSTTIPV